MKLWVARDKQNYLGLYYKKPTLGEHSFSQWCGGFLEYLDNSEFPEVTFENSPQQVEIKLIKK